MSSPGSSLRSSRTLVRPPSPLSNTPMGRLSMAGHRPFHRQGDQAVDQLGQGGAVVLHQLGVHADGGKAGQGVDLVDEDPAGAPLHKEIAAGQALAAQDRKSTRLNSSHVSISYAVFCLKKKIKTS